MLPMQKHTHNQTTINSSKQQIFTRYLSCMAKEKKLASTLSKSSMIVITAVDDYQARSS